MPDHDWLAGESVSLADLSLFAYTDGCEIGGFDLTPRPGIRDWLERIKAQSGHVSLDWLP